MKHLFSENWTELIFSNRNKEYGAYELRKLSDHNQLIGLISANIIFVLLITSYGIILKIDEDHLPETDRVTFQTNIERSAEYKKNPSRKQEFRSVEVEVLSNINFDFLKILPDKDITELIPEFPELKKGVISYSVDPKTGRQYNPEKSAEFEDGMDRFFMNVTNNISFVQHTPSDKYHYDKGDDEIDFEINTLIFVQCEINEKGKLDSVSIFKGASDPKFNDRVLEAFKKNDTWTVAMHNGKPVKQTLIIPYHFYYMQPLIKYYQF